MQGFRDLLVWRKAHALTLRVYRETASFPSCELYGLSAQVRRAAVSIGSNIADRVWSHHWAGLREVLADGDGFSE